MRILLTDNQSDLAKALTPQLLKHHSVTSLDSSTLLNPQALTAALANHDLIIHLAEYIATNVSTDIWAMNATGTFNIFEAAKAQRINKIIFISSALVDEADSLYGWSKLLGEEIAQRYVDQEQFNVLTLRPGTYTPYWNTTAFQNFLEWAKWFWRGGLHIRDVVQAITKSIDLISSKALHDHLVLPVSSSFDYSERDLKHWDVNGRGTTFTKYYGPHLATVKTFGLDPSLKPATQDIAMTKDWLGYEPSYTLHNLLSDLKQYGLRGPAVT